MKKAMIIVGILLLLSAAGGAGYYYFVASQENAKEPESIAETEVTPTAETQENAEVILDLESKPQETSEYYVIERRINVFNKPNQNALVVDWLYKGEKVTVLEKVDGWFRISEYIAYEEEGEETAEWLDSTQLSDSEPVIKEQERLEILDGYLQKSDDLTTHLDIFRRKTQQLLNERSCEPNDFIELGGWVRSVTYKNHNVYFLYCGGLEQENKIYLDVDKGEIFYP